MKYLLFTIIFLLIPISLLAGTITGKVYDERTNYPLIAANIIITNTQQGTLTDNKGNFTIAGLEEGSYQIRITYMGYKEILKTVEVFTDIITLIDFPMQKTILPLGEKVIVTANRANERETPIAFTNISQKNVRESFTMSDIPHIFKNTNGVYVQSFGGYGIGDTKVRIRGFDEEHLQVMINGITINDPETKKITWQQYLNLGDITYDIQIQRGVGSSLYGSGAFGGSINIETIKTPPIKFGGEISISGAMYSTYKVGLNLYTGLFANNKYALKVGGNFMQGNAWRKSTYFENYDYNLLLTRYFEKSDLRLLVYGAPTNSSHSFYNPTPKR